MDQDPKFLESKLTKKFGSKKLENFGFWNRNYTFRIVWVGGIKSSFF